MSDIKDLYFAEMECKFNELLDQGMDAQLAYEKTSGEAYHELGERIADMADRAILRQKEGCGPEKSPPQTKGD